MQLLAGEIFDISAALLNDTAKTVYTNAAQLPYLNLALQNLQENFELSNVPVTDAISTVINIPAGEIAIKFNGPGPKLPDDLIEIQKLWEREEGIDPYFPMTRVNSLSQQLAGTELSQFGVYVWESQEIKFLPASRDNDIKIEYIRNLFSPAVDANSPINVVNAASFLEFKNAALCARYIGENTTRADSLDGQAILALDMATGISSKGRQSIITRRRPFRATYKRRYVG
jgi:hypothetical protein